MKKKTLCLCVIGLLAAAGLLTGCTRTSEELILSKKNSATEEEIKTSLPENKDLDEVPLDEEETEREAAPVPEDGKAVSRSAYPVILTDTVKYVESSRKEITRTEKRLSVVDENDPSTYQIVRKEEAVEVQNEIPCEYQDEKGFPRYVWNDGHWYEYEYSSSDITLDEDNEELALMLLEMMGDSEGEVYSVNCEVLTGANAGYAFHVVYRNELTLEGEPSDTTGLIVSRKRTETTTQKQMVETKVPVEVEKIVPTGAYTYYGWQEQEGSVYYYDEHGEKVSGAQVIQGIRYVFDEDGKLISQAGVDVSSKSGTIDWKKVKESGISFALIRCGYRGASTGELFEDAACTANVAGARAAGLSVGLYFYSQAVTEEEATEEAEFIVQAARTCHVTAPLVITGGYTVDLAGRAEGVSPEERTTFTKAFCRKVHEDGMMPMIGGEAGWLSSSLDMTALTQEQIWVAQENSSVTWSGTYQIWQYTAQGSIDGISGIAGLNIITGDGRIFQ